MKRRDFLGLGLGLAALPALIREGFAASVPREEILEVSRAWRRAAEASRPLLVLVIPEDEGERWARGSALGAWLNNASEDSLARLGLCEVICAQIKDLDSLLPEVPADAVLVVADPRRFPAQARVAAPALSDPNTVNAWEDRAGYEALIDQQIEALEAAFAALMVPLLPSAFASQKARLAAVAMERWVGQRIAGSHWANSHGCGTDIEDYEENYAVGCGMGHVSEKAQRFLYFFEPGSGYF